MDEQEPKHRSAVPEEELLSPDSFLAPEERGMFCQDRPVPVEPSRIKIVRDFCNWAQANSVFILAFGTGCGAIEMLSLIHI